MIYTVHALERKDVRGQKEGYTPDQSNCIAVFLGKERFPMCLRMIDINS